MRGKKALALIIGLILAAVLAVTALSVINGGTRMYHENATMVTNERTSDKRLTDWLVNDKHFDIDAFRAKYKIDDIELESSVDGHKIPACYIYANDNADMSGDTVIMIHGVLGNRLSNFPMAQMFLDEGYNVITYDQRNSGGNTAQYVTFGYLESDDAMDYVRFARSKMSSASRLGIWGQSMGAATAQNAMDAEGFEQSVDFVVLDCPLGSMREVMGPKTLMRDLEFAYASALCKRELGFYYEDQSVYKQIENTTVPVMVAASESDGQLPFDMQMKIYNTIKEYEKKLYLVSDSRHSDIYFDHPDEYRRELHDFLTRTVRQ